MKKRTKRYTPLSGKWKRLVLSQADIEPSKPVYMLLHKLWVMGYSHKDTAQALREEFHGQD